MFILALVRLRFFFVVVVETKGVSGVEPPKVVEIG